MFDIIRQIINHSWQTNTTGDQSYIYSICAVIICLFFVTALDWLFRLFTGLFNKRV